MSRARLGVVLLVGGGLLAACSGERAAPPERIVLIVVDTLRRDHLSCYGSANPTPHIDALAARGQVFPNVLASFHQTSMSMGSLFTGRTPSIEFERRRALFWNSQSWCGMSRFAAPEDELCIPEGVPTLGERLRDAGYWTIGVASNQFLYEPSGFGRGFEDWTEVGLHPPEPGPLARLGLDRPAASRAWQPVNEAVVAALNRRPHDRVFLFVHYMDVHDFHDHDVSYAEAVRIVDAAVGRLLANLERAGLLAGATVVFTSDHGERLAESHALPGRPGHIGNPTFMEHLEIPLVVAPPVVSDPTRMLRTEDVNRLLLRIAGVEPQARSPLGDEELYLSEQRYQTYLAGRFKSSLRREDGALVLFDLERDPGELRDATANHPDVARRHEARIRELAAELSARRAVYEKLTEADRNRLRALGYLGDGS